MHDMIKTPIHELAIITHVLLKMDQNSHTTNMIYIKELQNLESIIKFQLYNMNKLLTLLFEKTEEQIDERKNLYFYTSLYESVLDNIIRIKKYFESQHLVNETNLTVDKTPKILTCTNSMINEYNELVKKLGLIDLNQTVDQLLKQLKLTKENISKNKIELDLEVSSLNDPMAQDVMNITEYNPNVTIKTKKTSSTTKLFKNKQEYDPKNQDLYSFIFLPPTDGKNNVVLYKSKECHHCQAFLPTFKKVSEKLKHKVNVQIIEANETNIPDYINGFPALVKNGNTSDIVYGGLEKKDLKKYLLS